MTKIKYNLFIELVGLIVLRKDSLSIKYVWHGFGALIYADVSSWLWIVPKIDCIWVLIFITYSSNSIEYTKSISGMDTKHYCTVNQAVH